MDIVAVTHDRSVNVAFCCAKCLRGSLMQALKWKKENISSRWTEWALLKRQQCRIPLWSATVRLLQMVWFKTQCFPTYARLVVALAHRQRYRRRTFTMLPTSRPVEKWVDEGTLLVSMLWHLKDQWTSSVMLLFGSQFPEVVRKHNPPRRAESSEGTEVNATYCYMLLLIAQQRRQQIGNLWSQTSRERVVVTFSWHWKWTSHALKGQYPLQNPWPISHSNLCRLF